MSKAAVQARPILALSAPAQYRVFQRSGTSGTIAITGTLTGAAIAIEARHNGGAWATIAASASGAFSGNLTSQAQGHGTLEVRPLGWPDLVQSVADVGIGDVFIVAGQSNASGRGTSNQVYAGSPAARLFGNDYAWKNLTDPTDSGIGQVDSISDDTANNPGGSVWPLIATSYLTSQGIPVAFVPCAKGGTAIASWQPGVDHQDRTTLYGSMVYRALQTGCKTVLWWQGERDAVLGTSQASYSSDLVSLANAINTDLGVKLMPCKLQTFTGASQAAQDLINAAIVAEWAVGNVLTGPDLSGLTTTPEDTFHLITNAKLLSAAALWWSALQAAFGYS